MKCEACGKELSLGNALETPLGYFVCLDEQECIAEFSGWNQPPTDVAAQQDGGKQ